jgi:hypothetical protein
LLEAVKQQKTTFTLQITIFWRADLTDRDESLPETKEASHFVVDLLAK